MGDLGDDPLSSESRSQRRGVLITSAVALLIIWLHLVPRQISLLGVTLQGEERRGVIWALMGLLLFFTVTFVVYAWADFTKWLLVQRRSRISKDTETRLAEQAREDLKRSFRNHPATHPQEREDAATQMISHAEEWVFREIERRKYVPLLQLSFVRALIDFLLPLVMAVLALVAMATWLSR